jgi:tetratricopeptide (TPR) repeat protein
LGSLYLYQKKYDQAEPQLLRALNIRKNLLGSDHPDVGFVLHNLAKVYFLKHHYAEAESLYRQAVAIREKSLGLNHPDLAHTLRAYALLLQKTKRKPEAAAMNERAQEILARHPTVRGPQQTVDVRDLARSGKAWRE